MEYFLGVDAGNTKTIAILADEHGRVVGYGRAGCGDIYAVGIERATETVAKAISDATQMASGSGELPACAGGFSMAGCDWPEDKAELQQALSLKGYAQNIVVTNDSVGALYAGSPDGWGIAVACGTSVATCAKSSAGQIWHHSFWQPLGGATALGKRAIEAICEAELGIQPQTKLQLTVPAFFGQPDVAELLHAFTGRHSMRPAHRVDQLARTVLDAASQGDRVARAIVIDEGKKLATYAVAAAKKAEIKGPAVPLVLAGSIFRHKCRLLQDTLVKEMRKSFPGLLSQISQLEPACGALLMAMDASGVELTDAIRHRMKLTAPPAQFFQT